MLGRKAKQFQQHPAVCLEDFVPQKNLYRQLEAKLVLSFIHALVAEHYSSRGRPSIDPVVFFKLPLIMFFEDLRSERQRGYHLHYVVDGGKARVILAALVTPATITDNMPMLDVARWVRFRWKVHPRIAVGDTKYGTIANIAELEQEGIRAYLPMRDYANDTPFFPPEQFRYDAERDVYICPRDQHLTRWTNKTEAQAVLDRADAAICNACPLKAQCTDRTSGKALRRSWFQEELDRVKGYWDTAAYAKAMLKRQVWVEPMFAEAKEWHPSWRFRLRRLEKVNSEALLTAAGQNLKRLLNQRKRRPRPWPEGEANAMTTARLPTFSEELLAS